MKILIRPGWSKRPNGEERKGREERKVKEGVEKEAALERGNGKSFAFFPLSMVGAGRGI